MNNTNLINPLLPKKQKEIHIWGYVSMFFFCGLITMLLFFSMYQIIIMWKLKKEVSSTLAKTFQMKSFEHEIADLENQNGQLVKQLNKVFLYQQKLANLVHFLSYITLSLPKDLFFTKLSLDDHKKIIIEGQALSSQSIIDFFSELEKGQFLENVCLDSLAQQNKSASLHFVMHATFKKGNHE